MSVSYPYPGQVHRISSDVDWFGQIPVQTGRSRDGCNSTEQNSVFNHFQSRKYLTNQRKKCLFRFMLDRLVSLQPLLFDKM